MLTPRMRHRNVRADVLDILQKDSRDGEVVSPNRPRGRFGTQKCRRGRRSMVLVPFRNLCSACWLLADLLAVTGGNGPHLWSAP